MKTHLRPVSAARGGYLFAIVMAIAVAAAEPATAVEPVTFENLVAPEPNRADEPTAEKFSLEKALHFLDSASLEWQRSWQCFTCHTNVSYLIARPSVSADAPAHREVRKYAEELVSLRWSEVGERFDAEVVALAAALALNDAATTEKLHPLTRIALDKMWSGQRPEGDWKWPTGCRWPPMESDDHYGATLATIAVGAAPDNYAHTPAAVAGMAKVRAYFKQHPPENLHQKGMLLWANSLVDGLLTTAERATYANELRATARPDGGWAFARLYPWKRSDDKEQDLDASDGYGTAFAVFVLRKAGVAVDDPSVSRGVAWLKSHQRASGRWFTRSLNKDNEHFISHAGSAYAVMALAACDALPKSAAAATSTAVTPSASATLRGQTTLAADAPPVQAYLAEQKRRHQLRVDGLRRRIAEAEQDAMQASLVPILKAQAAELETKRPELVAFDAAYDYPPTTGRLGYSKKVRLVENLPDGRAVILVDNAAVVLAGLGTESYAPGKFFGIEPAILVGAARADYLYRGQPKKCFDAQLVDLEAIVKDQP